jgi:hypothetical protein
MAPVMNTVTTPSRPAFFANQRDSSGVLDHGRGVWHANDGGKSAARRRGRSGRDGFFGALTRFAKMDMEID